MLINQLRIARPTHQLAELVDFYFKKLGFAKIGGFTNHAGYDGVMIGLPGTNAHLEFTQHTNAVPCPPPSLDNLLVFYLPDAVTVQELVSRLAAFGIVPVQPENPYWNQNGTTFEDPDGWRLVFYQGEAPVAGS